MSSPKNPKSVDLVPHYPEDTEDLESTKLVNDRASEGEHSQEAGGSQEDQGTASMFGTIANICKNVIGAGLLSLPVAVYDGRLYEATTGLVIIGFLNCLSFWSLGVISEGKASTYGDVWKKFMGERTRIVPDSLLFFNGMLTTSSYMIVIGDQMSKAIPALGQYGEGPFSIPRLVTILPIAFVVILPLSLLKDLGPLKYPSLLGLVATVFVVLFIIVDSIDKGYFSNGIPRVKLDVVENDPVTIQDIYKASQMDMIPAPNNALKDQSNNIQGGGTFNIFMLLDIIGIFNSGFACHYNSPRFYKELKDRTPMKYFIISAIAFTINVGIFLSFAHSGYWRWGGLLDGNVLKVYSNQPERPFDSDAWKYSKIPVYVAWICMAASVITAYPLVSNSMRSAAFQVLGKISCGKIERDVEKASAVMFWVMTILFVSITAVIGLTAVDLKIINGLKGITSTVSLCSIFPGVMLLAKTLKDKKYSEKLGLEAGSYVPPANSVDHQAAPLLHRDINNSSFDGNNNISFYGNNNLPGDDQANDEAYAPDPAYNLYTGRSYKKYKCLAFTLVIVSSCSAISGILIFSLNLSGVINTSRPKPWEKKFSMKDEKDDKLPKYTFDQISKDKEGNAQPGFAKAWMVRLIDTDIEEALTAQNADGTKKYDNITPSEFHKTTRFWQIWRPYCDDPFIQSLITMTPGDTAVNFPASDGAKLLAEFKQTQIRMNTGCTKADGGGH